MSKERMNEFIGNMEKFISMIQDEVDTMPHTGDKCITSQKMCLQQALNEFEYSVNGLSVNDFKIEK